MNTVKPQLQNRSFAWHSEAVG